MSKRIHALAQQLTGKETLEECSLDELRHMARRFPYFAPAQFLLLQKLRQDGTPEETEAQYRKAVLFYHDPLLFEQFISSDKFYVDETRLLQSLNSSPAEETWQEEELSPIQETQQEEESPFGTGPVGTIDTEDERDEEGREMPAQDHTETSPEEPIRETSLEEQRTPFASSEKRAEVYEPVAVDESGSAVAEEAVEDSTEERTLPSFQSTIQEPAAGALAFEPFHTVDYFASQGIKISDDQLPKDKLGKQVMSFTEWLKTMKRLPAAQMGNSPESPAEKKVETMASHSVTESNVVTEAMAEVWLKQGNTAKALDIYNKLSLLNPSKNAYFAAKIENLKQS